MSKSIVFFRDRNERLQIIDPDVVPHFEYYPPLVEIAVAVTNEGYAGVVFDEKQLFNGKVLLVMSTNQSTPEGQIIEELSVASASGMTLPPMESVLREIKRRYDEVGVRRQRV